MQVSVGNNEFPPFQGYIDNLHKNPDLRSKMKDPVKKLFESMEKKPEIDIPDLEKRLPEKRVCIIFHGAPFTGIYSMNQRT